MRFLQLCKADANYSSDGAFHTWDLPLNLQHRRIGLHSLFLELNSNSTPVDALIVRCNLIDRSMDNQNAILASLPYLDNIYLDKPIYTMTSSVIGRLFIM